MKLYPAVAVTLLVVAAAGCSDPATTSASPDPTTTVTVTASGSPSASDTPTSSASASAPQPPTTYAEARALVDASRDVTPATTGRLPVFTSPSGNIYCDLDVPACEIAEGQVDDPSACPDAVTTLVGRLELQANQPVAVCNTDTIVAPDAPELTYGTSVTTRDIQCVSEKLGMTCIARGAETGFFLARGRYLLFPS